MKLVPPSLLVVVAAAAAPEAALAHHSAARFDAQQTVSVEGTVTRYEWANPHVYIFVAAKADDGTSVEWEIEGQPPAMLRRGGWSADTLLRGDAVRLSGNPARSGAKVMSLTKLEKVVVLYDPQRMMAALASSDQARVAKASGFDGTWVTLLNMEAMQGFIAPRLKLKLTEAGSAAVAAYDERTMNPGASCIPYQAPGAIVAPDIKRIAVEGSTILIAGEFDSFERIVHLNAASHEGVEPSLQGHSIGHFEDDGKTLVIDTAAFASSPTGNGFRLRSSAQKRLVETLALDAAGTGLVYTFEVTDPEVLVAPFKASVQWAYRPDLKFAPLPCNLENARRFTLE
ncbi:MAG TPA: DUF6152 family protein [Gammaproteobacteria bacterium]|nr:DUF6152 family protein [Gammaproteobacteria bacterium]